MPTVSVSLLILDLYVDKVNNVTTSMTDTDATFQSHDTYGLVSHRKVSYRLIFANGERVYLGKGVLTFIIGSRL